MTTELPPEPDDTIRPEDVQPMLDKLAEIESQFDEMQQALLEMKRIIRGWLKRSKLQRIGQKRRRE